MNLANLERAAPQFGMRVAALTFTADESAILTRGRIRKRTIPR
jgi:hypothetical protein